MAKLDSALNKWASDIAKLVEIETKSRQEQAPKQVVRLVLRRNDGLFLEFRADRAEWSQVNSEGIQEALIYVEGAAQLDTNLPLTWRERPSSRISEPGEPRRRLIIFDDEGAHEES